MSRWVTFSNGQKKCLVIAFAKLKHIYELHTVNRIQSQAEFKKVVDEELDAYIKQTWPNEGVTVLKIEGLPYDAQPVIGSGAGRTYAFCYTPNECAGKGSCPKERACSE